METERAFGAVRARIFSNEDAELKATDWHRPLAPALVAASLLGPPCASEVKRRSPGKIEYQSEVDIAVGEIETPQPGLRVGLGVSVSSGQFFKGLVRVAGRSGVSFFKDGKPVRNFPEIINVRIRAMAYGINTTGPPWQMEPHLDADFMRSLCFSIASKRGLLEVPAQVIHSRAREVPFRETGPDEWDYEMEVQLKLVPLTDDITVAVLSSGGKTLARVTGGLDRPYNPMR